MRIALIRKDVFPEEGGAERYAATLARELLRKGHEVHLYAARAGGDLPPGLRVHAVPLWSRWSPLKNLSFAWSVRRMLAGERYDVVQALSQAYPSDVYRVGDGFHRHWLARGGSRLAAIAKAFTFRHRVILGVERRIMDPRNYRRVIAISAELRRQAVRLYKAAPSRVHVVYNGVDAARFARREGGEAVRRRFRLTEQDVILLFPGNNYRRKGLGTVLEAMARAGDARFHLLVVGREKGGAFRRRAARLGIAERVHFAGQTERIEDYYAAAHALVFPPIYEAFGNVVLEAMAAGLPVVTSRTCGASDLVRDGENGFLIPDGRSVDALAEVLPRLASPALRKVLGAKGAQVSAVMTPALNAEATLAIHRKVLEEKLAERRAGRPIETAALGDLVASRAAVADLERAGVVSYDALAALPAREVLKAERPERRAEAVEVGGERCVRKVFAGAPQEAEGEWRMLAAFAAAGLGAPTPLAWGRRGREALLLTRFVQGAERLDHWAEREVKRLPPADLRLRRRAVLAALGREVRAMHRAGFNHRDLYLCHVWIRWEGGPRFLFMDLHRAEHRRAGPPRRRVVKDLAALCFSASRWVRLTERDRLRFLKAYLGVDRLRAEHRALARAVLRKSARMAHHNRGRAI